MKIFVNAVTKQEIKFPCLMRNNHSGAVALFNSPTTGMIFEVGNSGNMLGTYCDTFYIEYWVPLLPGESVTLVQE